MAKYKIGGISFNGEDDVPKKKKGMLKTDMNFSFETDLASLSLDGLFETNPPKLKKEGINNKPKVVDLKKSKKKKKGNELI